MCVVFNFFRSYGHLSIYFPTETMRREFGRGIVARKGNVRTGFFLKNALHPEAKAYIGQLLSLNGKTQAVFNKKNTYCTYYTEDHYGAQRTYRLLPAAVYMSDNQRCSLCSVYFDLPCNMCNMCFLLKAAGVFPLYGIYYFIVKSYDKFFEPIKVRK